MCKFYLYIYIPILDNIFGINCMIYNFIIAQTANCKYLRRFGWQFTTIFKQLM